ncbi:MAG: rRNA maturation RNase YbeY [Bacteroidetes bacterium]|nr:rRNA maturation RNase YbeY [Bacteroidota bacterium]
MNKPGISLKITRNLFPDKFDFPSFRRGVKDVITYVLFHEKETIGAVNVLFCNDGKIIGYNKKYLNHDYETDIITFRYDGGDSVESDIIISVETVKRNSLLYKSGFINELYRVVIHGILHLCGYEDGTARQRTAMRKKENYYLKILGIN